MATRVIRELDVANQVSGTLDLSDRVAARHSDVVDVELQGDVRVTDEPDDLDRADKTSGSK